jgi:hypothetical protein
VRTFDNFSDPIAGWYTRPFKFVESRRSQEIARELAEAKKAEREAGKEAQR